MKITVLTAAVALFAIPSTAIAGAGDLDRSFGVDGTVRFEAAISEGVAVAATPHGTLVAGESPGAIYVERLRDDGTRDQTFGILGRWSLDGPMSPAAMTTLADGRIVLVGTEVVENRGQDALVLVIAADGSRVVGTHLLHNGGNERAYAVAPGPAGTVLVAGSFTPFASSAQDAVVWRVRPETGLDKTFDADGTAGMDAGGHETPSAITVAPSGEVVIAGEILSASGASSDVAVWRLKPDGDPANALNSAVDTTFDADGVAIVHRGDHDRPTALAVLPDGKILVAGSTSHAGGKWDGVVWRLQRDGGAGQANGALDRSFDADGQVLVDEHDQRQLRAMAVQPDGAILVAGLGPGSGNDTAAALWRLREDGATDASFGKAGLTLLPGVRPRSIALTENRRILVSGSGRPGGGFVSRVHGDPFALTVSHSGGGQGTVISAPAGIECAATCTGAFDFGSTVRLMAVAASGSRFAGWTGRRCSGTGDCLVTMDGDQALEARFEPLPAEPAKPPVLEDPPVPVPASFGARTLVTLEAGRLRRGRRLTVTVRNANAFAVSGTLIVSRPRGVRRRPLRIAANGSKRVVLRLPRTKGRRLVLRATVEDPAGHARTVVLKGGLR